MCGSYGGTVSEVPFVPCFTLKPTVHSGAFRPPKGSLASETVSVSSSAYVRTQGTNVWQTIASPGRTDLEVEFSTSRADIAVVDISRRPGEVTRMEQGSVHRPTRLHCASFDAIGAFKRLTQHNIEPRHLCLEAMMYITRGYVPDVLRFGQPKRLPKRSINDLPKARVRVHYVHTRPAQTRSGPRWDAS